MLREVAQIWERPLSDSQHTYMLFSAAEFCLQLSKMVVHLQQRRFVLAELATKRLAHNVVKSHTHAQQTMGLFKAHTHTPTYTSIIKRIQNPDKCTLHQAMKGWHTLGMRFRFSPNQQNSTFRSGKATRNVSCENV